MFLLALAAGCKSNPADTAIHDQLYSELRMWEDEVSMLEGELSEAEARLDSCRRENMALRQQLGQRGSSATPSEDAAAPGEPPSVEIPDATSEPPAAPGGTPEEALPPHGSEDAPPYVPPGSPGEALPDPPSAGRHPQPRLPLGGLRAPQVSHSPQQAETPITDWLVHEITLNRQLTGGQNRDGHPGDEGIMIVIEPRNKAGQILEVPGEVSVVVTDPSRPGAAGRVARWDFTMDEAADRFRQSVVGKGIHVDLPWPSTPPVGRTLNLYVRFQTDDGRKLMAERQIQVDPLSPEANPHAVRRDRSQPHTAPTGRAAQRYGNAWGAVSGRAPRRVPGEGSPGSPAARTARVEPGPHLSGAGAGEEIVVEEPHFDLPPGAVIIHEGDTVEGEVVHEGAIVREGETVHEGEAVPQENGTPQENSTARRKTQWSPDRM